MNNADNFLWVEKYRPQSISDCILPTELKNTFQSIVEGGELPNMMLTGTAGLGKTTVAKAICKTLGLDYIVINGSEEGNIDTLRGKIKQFASSVSLSGGYKVVILDEADYLNPQSTQPALRGFIEEFSNNCRFILTCNFKNRVIEPLHSRCGVYEFNVKTNKDRAELGQAFFMRCKDILTKEGVEFNTKVVANLVMKHFPDLRRALNELQRAAIGGSITTEVLIGDNDKYTDVYKHLKSKDFKKMRQWVVNNIDLEPASIFRGIYDTMESNVASNSIPQLVLILADYQYKNAFVADHELNLVACMTECMANVEFK
jgi:DNA polymerase III delta prime subunit|tara:strand:+ start:10784 stop:11728 length:945 start_codon:yes stop_codon:yes gene_type:complete